MPHSTQHANGWISVPIDPRFETKAQKMRAVRDKMYGNIFTEKDTDLRWVGDLGEMVFNSWLAHLRIPGVEWIVDEASGKPDFILDGKHKIGVKTVKRKDAPRPHYAAGMTARHTMEPVDHFFFMTYEHTARKMWLIGGLSRKDFLAQSRHYASGEYVHAKYQIRAGHEINNIDMKALITPDQWLREVFVSRDMMAA